MSPEERRAYQREWRRAKYENDPELKRRDTERATARRRLKRQTDPEFAARERETARRYRQSHPEKVTEYHRRWYEKNREQVIADAKAYYEKHRERYRARTVARIYGISVEEYAAMVERQNNLCAICGRPETAVIRGKAQTLSVDHDHETNRVRGLLCGQCNTGLGLLGDSPERLRVAASYVEAQAA